MKKLLIKIIIILAIPVLAAFIFLFPNNNQIAESSILKGKSAIVYRSKSCGCCANYIAYLKSAGVQVKEELNNDEKMQKIRREFGVKDELASCHTARIDGYTVEGHMPIEAIEKLVTEKPNLAGIALPAMPAGSPGMPGRKIQPFQITAFTATGSTSPYLSL